MNSMDPKGEFLSYNPNYVKLWLSWTTTALHNLYYTTFLRYCKNVIFCNHLIINHDKNDKKARHCKTSGRALVYYNLSAWSALVR